MNKLNLKNLSYEELMELREKVRPLSISSKVSDSVRKENLHIRDIIDKELSKRNSNGETQGYPKHSSGCWYISGDW